MTPLVAHATYAVSNATVRRWPFPHAVISDLLPWNFYDAVADSLPPVEEYTTLSALGRVGKGTYEQRRVITQEMAPKGPISELFSLAGSVDFCDALLRPFGIKPTQQIGTDALLVSDLNGYKIGPHTDAPHRIVSLLLYIPVKDGYGSPGTSLYVPKDRNLTHDGTKHLKFEDFDRVAKAPFADNCALLFARTDNSFHGVEPIVLLPGGRRDMFLVNLRWGRPTG